MKAMNLQRRRQVAKSATVIAVVADLAASCAASWCGSAQEFVEQSQLVHQFQRRGMDGVAAKIAEEIGVLLQHDDVDAGPRQQEAQHHPGRTAADDAATRREGFRRHRVYPFRRTKVPSRPNCGLGSFYADKGIWRQTGPVGVKGGCTATARFLLRLPACGRERVGVRGSPKHGVETYTQGNARPGPYPARWRAPTSPRKRGEVKGTDRH